MHTIPLVHRVEGLGADAVGCREHDGTVTVFVARTLTPLLRRVAVAHCNYVLSVAGPGFTTVLGPGQARQARRDRVWVR